jgi:hypothetical protein
MRIGEAPMASGQQTVEQAREMAVAECRALRGRRDT